MLMLTKRIPHKVKSIIGLAPAPDFPKLLIWDKMNMTQKKSLIYNKKIIIHNNNNSTNEFSYHFIKDSFKNLVLINNITFNGHVYIFHGMQDNDVPYSLSVEIINKIKGSKKTKLLLDKNAGHRLSDINQLQTIKNIMHEVVSKT